MQNAKRDIKRNHKALNPYHQRSTYSPKPKGLSSVILCQVLRYLDTNRWLKSKENNQLQKTHQVRLNSQCNLLKGTAKIDAINRIFSVTSTPEFREWAPEKAGGSWSCEDMTILLLHAKVFRF